MVTGDLIRMEIQELLDQYGYSSNDENIEIIFNEHMNDQSDRPLGSLIRSYSHLLQK